VTGPSSRSVSGGLWSVLGATKASVVGAAASTGGKLTDTRQALSTRVQATRGAVEAAVKGAGGAVGKAVTAGLGRLKKDMTSTTEECLKILQDVKRKNPEKRAEIEFVMRSLISGVSFRPSVSTEATDPDTTRWLAGECGVRVQRPLAEGALAERALSGGWADSAASAAGSRLLPPARQGLTVDSAALLAALAALDSLAEFDVAAVSAACPGSPLFAVGWAVLQRTQLVQRLGLDEARLAAFFAALESGFGARNTFHTPERAAELVQAGHALILASGLLEELSAVQLYAFYLACAIADYRHPGTTAGFQCAVNSIRAVTYNDRAVHQNYALASAFQVMRRSESDPLEGLGAADRAEIRALVIDLVLATDLARHFDILGRHKATLAISGGGGGGGGGGGAGGAPGSPGPLPPAPKDVPFLLQIVIKVTDVSETARPTPVYLRSVERRCEELAAQGDQEEAMSLPKSPFADRASETVPKMQLAIFDFVALPLLGAASLTFKGMEPALAQAKKNRGIWAPEEHA
jgi:hypothetical protein